ncbi:hypothetical protein NEOC65_000718 [Neochlamydia sp. AcF65]|nr:hypothetical protein [Neochlamydia sp. AcF65]MBS4170431.1 hypothetical protein [Neochlamydia sp. AcF95]
MLQRRTYRAFALSPLKARQKLCYKRLNVTFKIFH